MKKSILTIIAAFTALFGWTQTDFRTALEAAKGVEYTEYWNIYKDENGQQITDPRYKVNLVPVANEFGKTVGFDAIDITEASKGKKRLFYRYEDDQLDHYSHPAFIRNSDTKRGYAIIEGVLFEFTKLAADGSSFNIDALWFPKKEKAAAPAEAANEDGKKKKVNLKAKLDQVKKAMAGNPLINEFKQKDLNQMVVDYFAAMKKLQAANPLSDQDKKEVAAMAKKVKDRNAEIQEKNAAYWNSEEGQRVRQQMREDQGKPSKWTIVNGGDQAVNVGINGQTKTLQPGQSWQISCLSDAFYAHLEGTQWKHDGLIGKGKDNCGKTITIR